MHHKPIPHAEDLRNFIKYSPESGEFLWKPRADLFFKSASIARAWNNRWAGSPAFSTRLESGYLCGRFFGKVFLAHRVAWAMENKDPGDLFIDHINGNKSDNRISNLRLCTAKMNARNRPIGSNNKSGFIGVSWHSTNRRWQATITIDKKTTHIGYFETALDAAQARRRAEMQNGFRHRHVARDTGVKAGGEE